jgi:ASC-1-like (ASCH) protein
MASWTLDVIVAVYYQIACNMKTVEGRAPDPLRPDKNYGAIVPGDTLVIRAVDEEFKPLDLPMPFMKTAVYVKTYATAKELLEQEGLQNVLPGFLSIEDAIELYHSFPGYIEREEKHGMVAIGLK